MHIGEALTMNEALTSLKCAAISPIAQAKYATTAEGRGGGGKANVPRNSSLCFCLSLNDNKIGVEGAKHIGEALKMNKALTSLKCAPPSAPAQAKYACFVSEEGR